MIDFFGTFESTDFIMAPFYDDLDNRTLPPGPMPGIYFDTNTDRDSVVIIWHGVGIFNQDVTAPYTFQLEMIDLGDGDTRIVYRSEDMGNLRLDSFQIGLVGEGGPRLFLCGGTATGALGLAEDMDRLLGNTGVGGVWVFDIVDGQLQADDLFGDANDNNLSGDGNADSLIGRDGDDTLDSGKGNDTLTLGEGNDTVLVRLGMGDDVVTDFDISADTFDFSALSADERAVITVSENASGDRMLTLSGASTVTQTGVFGNFEPTGAVTITGTATEDETLIVETGTIGADDVLGTFSLQWLRDGVEIAGETAQTYTTKEADANAAFSVVAQFTDDSGTLETLTRADVTVLADVPTPGADDLIGTDGNDMIDLLNGADNFVALAGDVTVFGRGASDTLDGGNGKDSLRGDGQNDSLLAGEGGNDELLGGGGYDTLGGGIGNDELCGQSGSDVLTGAAGNDTLHGGFGDDTLNGGQGADMFIYNAVDGHDVVRDFQDDIDSIQLGNTAFTLSLDNGDAILTFSSANSLTIEGSFASIAEINAAINNDLV